MSQSQDPDNQTAIHFLPWFQRAAISFAFAMASGGLCIPFVHFLVYSDTDPFAQGWPLLLEGSAFLSAFLIALRLRCTAILALGIYLGLLGFMFASGKADYPGSSAIGLAIHGFLPAALGSALAFGLIYLKSSGVPRK